MKRILLIATGGTIASTEDGNGLSPALTGEELAQSVPEISGLCELDVVQPMNIDSTNMRPSDWMRIRDVIVEGYADHDGFVILHGTDTMSYTAAALSYLIQDSPKPIVLTGSQKPMGNPFTDAKLNLYQSLLYALDEHSHDVSIVFGGVAIAGTRARKQRTMSFNAFISVNYPPIAYIRNDRIVRNGLHGTHQGENPVRFYDSIDPRVFVLKLTPGVNPGILDALADSYDAVILETFGIGGIPEFGESGESFQEAIFRWVDSGRTVVMTTQVPKRALTWVFMRSAVPTPIIRHFARRRYDNRDARGQNHVGTRPVTRCRRDPAPVLQPSQPRPHPDGVIQLSTGIPYSIPSRSSDTVMPSAGAILNRTLSVKFAVPSSIRSR